MAIKFGEYNTVERNEMFHLVTKESFKKYNISFDEACSTLVSFDKLADILHVSKETIIDITLNVFAFPFKDLFDFVIYESDNSILVKKQAVYKTNRVKKGYDWVEQTEYYNVYLKENDYINLILHKVGLYVLGGLFPHIIKNEVFCSEVRRFPKGLEINPNMKVNDMFGLEYQELTAQDIADLINNPNAINDTKLETNFHYYAMDKVVYLRIGKRRVQNYDFEDSIAIPLEALFKNDWKLVEDYYVHSIVKSEANDKMGRDTDNYYNGKQSHCPFWKDNETVEKLKELFNKN